MRAPLALLGACVLTACAATKPAPGPATAAAGARAPGPPDGAGGDRFVVLAGDTELFAAPAAGAPHARVGPAAAPGTGHLYPRRSAFRLVAEHGDWLEVETIADDTPHCQRNNHILWGLALRLFVHRAALQPVLTRELALRYEDGTSVTLRPGTPLAPLPFAGEALPPGPGAGPGGAPFEVSLEGSLFTVVVPPDAVGTWYRLGAPFDAPPSADYLHATTLLADAGRSKVSLFLSSHAYYVHATRELGAGRLLVTLRTTCSEIVAVSAGPVVTAFPVRPRAAGGAYEASTEEGLHVAAGAAVAWAADGRAAGAVVLAHPLRYDRPLERTAAHACFEVALSTGPAPPEERTLPLCFAAAALVDVAPARPVPVVRLPEPPGAACAGIDGVGDPEAVAASPRADAAAELVALELGGGVVASTADYDRVRADLAAIRALRPELEATPDFGPDRHGYFARLAPDALALVKGARSFPVWDCLTRYYGLDRAYVDAAGGVVHLTLHGLYEPRALARMFTTIPGVTTLETYPAGELSRTCARRTGAIVKYHFVLGREHCLIGCERWDHAYAYTTAPGKAVYVAGYTEAPGKKPPAAFKDAPACDRGGR